MRRGVLGALAVAAVAVGGSFVALALAEEPDPGSPWKTILTLLVGWSFVGTGLVAWSRWPDNRTGALMTLVGFLWLGGQFQFVEDPPVLQTLGELVRPLHHAAFAHLLLAFPTGRLDSRLARGLVIAVYVDLGILENLPGPLSGVSFALAAVLFGVIVGVLAHRWRTESGAWRRSVAPVLWSGVLVLALVVIYAASLAVDRSLFSEAGAVMFRLAFAVIPFAFLAGLLRSRLARASVAELVVELERARPSGSLRDHIAHALGDPSLVLAYWLPGDARYVDLAGQPVELPREGEERMATVVERDGVLIAALIHDRVLAHDAELLRAVSAAAGLALENERLQAELRARLEELRASRARIVEATTEERKRIERNLHDATQQRLTSVAVALGLAESKLDGDPGAAGAILDQAREGLAVALAELRDLSQGIHPGILTERGLGVALEDLAYTAPIPINVDSNLSGRLPEPVEAGAYYVVAEALANVAKHAGASSAEVGLRKRDGRLVLTIHDDGVGGADPLRGSGLRGLADRVQALGGTLAVESPPGRGTELRAEIPCA
jgi:signal transduction histidine kinase